MEQEKGYVASTLPRGLEKHVSKRSLKNKGLSVGFNEKDLRDYVGGFHKRKKKRRKEAQKQIEEKERRKRLENRKKRKQDKEYAMNGGAPAANDDGAGGEDSEQVAEEPKPSVSGTTTYENGDVMVTVKTSEIASEEEEEHPTELSTPLPPMSTGEAVKKHNIPVSKKKPFKQVKKGKSRPKLHNKRDRRKGLKGNKRK